MFQTAFPCLQGTVCIVLNMFLPSATVEVWRDKVCRHAEGCVCVTHAHVTKARGNSCTSSLMESRRCAALCLQIAQAKSLILDERQGSREITGSLSSMCTHTHNQPHYRLFCLLITPLLQPCSFLLVSLFLSLVYSVVYHCMHLQHFSMLLSK